jgi:hypothetical protein
MLVKKLSFSGAGARRGSPSSRFTPPEPTTIAAAATLFAEAPCTDTAHRRLAVSRKEPSTPTKLNNEKQTN